MGIPELLKRALIDMYDAGEFDKIIKSQKTLRGKRDAKHDKEEA